MTFCEMIYSSLQVLQNDLDEWLNHYNNDRPHQGKRYQARTSMYTFIEGSGLFEHEIIYTENEKVMIACQV